MRTSGLGMVCAFRNSVKQTLNTRGLRLKYGVAECARLTVYLAAALALGACTIWPPTVEPITKLPEEGKLRFVVMGDSGHGNQTQESVAATIKRVCDHLGGCDFALLLGDNIYNSGASHVTDQQFLTKFEYPYAKLKFPFFAVLGNHDYGGGGAGLEAWKGRVQIKYTNYSKKWKMPAHYYSFSATDGTTTVDFFALDTNAIFYSSAWLQKCWLRRTLERSEADWKIVYGHHPYISNGQHGNAGEYEKDIVDNPLINGDAIKEFIEEKVCGKANLYLAGHDHNRQWLEPKCGTEFIGTQFIVSGSASGAKPRGTTANNPVKWENYAGGGFVLIEVQDNSQLWVRFYDDTPGNPPVPNFEGALSH